MFFADKWTKFRDSTRFAYTMLIAPWPIFTVFLIVSSVIGGILPLLQIQVTTGLVDTLASHLQSPLPTKNDSIIAILAPYYPWLLLTLVIMIVNWIMYMDTFQRYLAARLNERVQQNFDQKFYAKALNMRLEYFESSKFHDVMQRALRSMEGHTVSNQLAQLQRLLSATCSLIGIMWMLGTAHWFLPLILLLGTIILLKWRVKSGIDLTSAMVSLIPVQRKRSYMMNMVTERAPASEIRLYGLAAYMIGRWRELSDRMMNQFNAVQRSNMAKGIPVVAIQIGIHASILSVLLLLGAEGKLSAGVLIALMFAVQQYLDRIQNISWRIEGLHRFCSELQQARHFFAMKGEEPASGIKLTSGLKEGIRFESVSFSYPGIDKPVIDNLNLIVRPGEKIALVGENGAGKSTIAKLLLGLYHPVSGNIWVDNLDLNSLDPKYWRERTGAVFQDYVRYSLTVRENIGFGCLDKINDLEAIDQAAQRSSISGTINMMPAKYDTVLGKEFEGGQELSGGQWQKIALARAYLRDAEIVVLDEPAAALDALSEMEVYRNFLQLAQGKTVLLISHRLGSAQLADKIVFVEQGRIAEEGSHEQLMELGGKYAQLYRRQAEWYNTDKAGV